MYQASSFPSPPQQQQQAMHPNIFTSSMQPPHLLPPPVPFNLQDMPWAQSQRQNQLAQEDTSGIAMHFQAQNPYYLSEEQRRFMLHQKRKNPNDFQAIAPPAKQFISEEKFTEHFNGLHISSSYIQNADSPQAMADGGDKTGKCFTNLTYKDYQMTAKALEEKLLNANRITICEDIKRFTEQERKAVLLPEPLLNHMEKSSTALVLWKPPPYQVSMELLQRKSYEDMLRPEEENNNDNAENRTSRPWLPGNAANQQMPSLDAFEDPFEESAEIDDYLDNNNTCTTDFNKINNQNVPLNSMDEDL